MQFRGELTKGIIAKKPSTPTKVDAIPKPGSIFRKDALLEINGFDENMVSGEDIDLSWRLVERGWKLLLIPHSFIYKRLRSNFRDYIKQQYWYGRGIPQLFIRHPKRMKHIFAFYSGLIILFFLLIFSPRLALFLLLLFLFSPLPFYFSDLKSGKLLWNIEHLFLAYIKTTANVLGILRSTPSIFTYLINKAKKEKDEAKKFYNMH